MKGFVVVCSGAPQTSGMSLAAEHVCCFLKKKGLSGEAIWLPSLNRREKEVFASFFTFLKIPLKYVAVLQKIVFGKQDCCYFVVGQSWWSWIREVIPLSVIRFKNPEFFVVALHGSWFLNWPKDSFKFKCFRWLINRGKAVAVLGPKSKTALQESGVSSHLVSVINRPDFELGESDRLLHYSCCDDSSLTFLFLSNLSEAKGYSVFLDAIVRLYEKYSDKMPQCRFLMVGDLIRPKHSVAEASFKDSFQSVSKRLEAIRRLGGTVEWLGSVSDKEQKRSLFTRSDVFVFPSEVECQPLVLIEAMAERCAIITTCVGEIPWMLPKDTCVFIKPSDSQELAERLFFLSIDRSRIRVLQERSLKRYKEFFCPQKWEEQWSGLLF